MLAELGVPSQPANMSFGVSDGRGRFEWAARGRARDLRPPAPPRRPPVHPHAVGPRALQPRGARARRRQRQRPLARRVPRGGPLLRLLHRPPDRPPGLGGLVRRPRADVELPGLVPRDVLRQPRRPPDPQPADLADDPGRLAALRRGADRALRRPDPPPHSGPAPARGSTTAASRSTSTTAPSASTRPSSPATPTRRWRCSPSRTGSSASSSRAFPYQPNEAVLHTDTALMPRRRGAWASWNFHLTDEPTGRTTVTYDMNRLQSLACSERYLVTLNRTEAIDPERVIRRIDYAHPVFTKDGVAAQAPLGGDQRRRPRPLLRRLLALGLPRGRRLVGAPRRRGARRPRARRRLAARRPCRRPPPTSRRRAAAGGRVSTALAERTDRRRRGVRRRGRPPARRSTRAGSPTAAREPDRALLPLPRSSCRSSTSTGCPELLDPIPLWSARRRAPARYRRSDYLRGHGDERTLGDAARDLVAERTGSRPAGPVLMLANPRYWGIGFNPVSFYFAYGETAIEAMIAEVTNTPWGQRRCYVLAAGPGRASGRVRQAAPRLPVHADGADLRVVGERARRAARRHDRQPRRARRAPSSPPASHSSAASCRRARWARYCSAIRP